MADSLQHATRTLAVLLCAACDSAPHGEADLDAASGRFGVPEIVTSVGAYGDSAMVLFRVRSGYLTSSGQFVVAHDGGPGVRTYSLTGNLIGEFGRRGSGPGEFDRLGWAGPLGGDSILTYDGGSSVFEVFDRQGAFARAFEAAADIGGRGRQPVWIDVLGGEVVLGLSTGLPEVAMYGGEAARDSLKILRLALDGSSVRELAAVANRWWARSPERGSISMRADEDGPFAVVAASEATIFYSDNDLPIVERVAMDGELLPPWELPFLEPTDRSDEAGTGRGGRYIEQLFVSDAGELWVGAAEVSGDSLRVWYRLDRAGRVVGGLRLPLAMRVLDMREELLLTRHRDSLDVEHVTLLLREAGER